MSVLAAASAVGAGIESIGKLTQAVRDYQTDTAVSLPSYLKSTNIMSRIYIEESISDEEIILPLVGMLNQVYAGFVLTALQLNHCVAGSRTVRRLLEVVATEDYDDTTDIIENKLGLTVHTEDSKVISLESKEQKLFSGRVIELDLNLNQTNNPNSDNKNTKVMLFVQLIPTIITNDVGSQVIQLNLGTSFNVRFKKMRAGEISFFSDFIFERDLINDKRKALKQDRTGLLYEILQSQNNKLSKALMGLIGVLPKNHNLANSIFVVDQKTFKSACGKAGLDFNNKHARENFFKQSFIMLLVVVDTNYNKVTIYFNGLDSKGEYSFKMIQANSGAGSSGSDKYDLKDIMTAMSHGMSPKF